MPPSTLLVLGDSVTWGQGLLTENKFSTLVQENLNARGQTLTVTMLAHSGATIGIRGPTLAGSDDGEVPVSFPTVVQQVAGFSGDPTDVALILLSGGINDVDIRRILNPLTNSRNLRHLIKQYCHDDMVTLLSEVTAKFSSPDLPVVVTGYFPILSADSHPLRIPFLLNMHGIGVPFFIDFPNVFAKIVSLSMQFWTESTDQLQQAVADVNNGNGNGRVRFAGAPFAPINAAFASVPWLFGLTGDFAPQDEVVASRHEACNVDIPPIDLFARESCYRASAGHPNQTGAAQYAAAITGVL